MKAIIIAFICIVIPMYCGLQSYNRAAVLTSSYYVQPAVLAVKTDYSIQQIRQKRRQRSIHHNHQKLAKNPYKDSKKNVGNKGLHAPYNDTMFATYRRELACLEGQLIARNKKGAYYHKRLDALRATQKNGESIARAVSIGNDVRWFAQQYGIALNDLIGGSMNLYEYQLHTEFVEQLTEAEQLKPVYDRVQEYSFFLDAVGYSAALGIEANNHHDAITATHWADILEKSLDIAKGIGEGICEGLYDTAMLGVHFASWIVDKALHPLDSFAALGRGMESIVSLFAQGVGTAIQFKGFNQPGYRINFEKESQQLLYQMSAAIVRCSDKIAKMSARERVRCVTHLGTEFFAPALFFKAAKILCTRMKPLLEVLVAAAYDEGVALEFATGEKVILNVASDLNQGSSSCSTVKKVANMEHFFREFEFGKTLKTASIKLKKPYNGASIFKVVEKIEASDYLKKGYHYYLDTFHNDHLEVFNKRGIFKFVLNLDGSVNIAKTKTAYTEGRTIKALL